MLPSRPLESGLSNTPSLEFPSHGHSASNFSKAAALQRYLLSHTEVAQCFGMAFNRRFWLGVDLLCSSYVCSGQVSVLALACRF